nr:luciferase family protein [uncultured Albidiferax sp.]
MPGLLGYVSDEVMSWPGVIAAKHWDLYRPGVPDGADFYIGDSEIGHIHFYGEAHVASNKALCDSFVKLCKARPFRYRADPSYQYWTQVQIGSPEQAQNAIDLLRANYQRLRSGRG